MRNPSHDATKLHSDSYQHKWAPASRSRGLHEDYTDS